MVQLYSNNSKSSLASGISGLVTAITVATGEGTKFPSPTGSDYFLATIVSAAINEIVKCTSRTGDVLTVVRGQEGTTAKSWSSGTTIEMRVTRDTLTNLRGIPSFDDYGAVGDGITNDAAAVSTAFTAHSGKMVRGIAGKTYKLNSFVTVPANTVIVMEGGSKFSGTAPTPGLSNGCVFIGHKGTRGSTTDMTRGLYVEQVGDTATIDNSLEPNILTWNMFLITADAADVEGAAGGQVKSNGLMVKHQMGGSTMTGGRHALYGVAEFNATSKATNGDRNYVAIQGHCIASANDNGTGGSKQGALFALGGIVHCGAAATHMLNVTGCELNTTVEAATLPFYRTLLQVASRDSDRGTTYDGMICLSDISSNANGLWTDGILIGPMNGAAPLRSTGSILRTTGTSTIANVIDVSSYTVTGSLLLSQNLNIQPNSILMIGSTPSIEMGAVGSSNAPFIDFHSSASATDYDARIQASGGTASIGAGALTVTAATFVTNEHRPNVDNTYNLGTAAFGWKEVFADNGVINTSDARKKENVQTIDGNKALTFLNALNPVTFKYRDYTVEEVIETEEQDVPVTRDEEYFRDERQGEQFVRVKKIRQVPVMREIPIVDESGKLVMEAIIDYKRDADGNLIMDAHGKPIKNGVATRPAVKLVPVTERKLVSKKAGAASEHIHKRTHWGLIAQQVEAALGTCGMTTEDFGGFIRDESVDYYGLRYEQFIAPLIAAVQELAAEVKELKTKVELSAKVGSKGKRIKTDNGN